MESTSSASKERLLTPKEFCERCGVSDRWLKRALSEGRVKPTKMGKLNRFPESYVDELVRDGLPLAG